MLTPLDCLPVSHLHYRSQPPIWLSFTNDITRINVLRLTMFRSPHLGLRTCLNFPQDVGLCRVLPVPSQLQDEIASWLKTLDWQKGALTSMCLKLLVYRHACSHFGRYCCLVVFPLCMDDALPHRVFVPILDSLCWRICFLEDAWNITLR